MTSISFAGVEPRRDVQARSRRDSDRTYRRAMRHSRFVRWLRAMLLGVIALVLLAVVVDNYLPIAGLRLPAGLGSVVIKGTMITMQQPHLTGFTSDERPYEFTADAAHQDITKPDFVNLQTLRAKIEMADKSIVHLWANDGIFNMKTSILDLSGNIRLVSSTGYAARLSKASVDMNEGTVVSDTPVWVKLLDGDLNAKKLQILDKGDELHFTDVTMVLQSGKQGAKEGQP
ncbi:MAG: LPS export ABC transporter periplasmic protein LptC [Xanthobacteraceae bacterium]